jgi:hypothetical protein
METAIAVYQEDLRQSAPLGLAGHSRKQPRHYFLRRETAHQTKAAENFDVDEYDLPELWETMFGPMTCSRHSLRIKNEIFSKISN